MFGVVETNTTKNIEKMRRSLIVEYFCLYIPADHANHPSSGIIQFDQLKCSTENSFFLVVSLQKS